MKATVRHSKRWLRFWAKCGAATWLVHTATGLGWLQSLAAVALVLWAGIEAVRVLERLLRAYVADPDDGGEGPEAEPPIAITPTPREYREWRNRVRNANQCLKVSLTSY